MAAGDVHLLTGYAILGQFQSGLQLTVSCRMKSVENSAACEHFEMTISSVVLDHSTMKSSIEKREQLDVSSFSQLVVA